MRRSWLVIGTLAVALATTAACDPLGAASGSAPSGGAASGGTTAVGAAAPSGSATPADVAAFCALAKAKGAQNLEVFDAQSTTPEEAHQVLVNIDALAAAAPQDIHADFALFADFEHRLADAGGNATGDLAQEAGGAELRDALVHIAAYLDQNCGIRK